jgi:hypothetical protein
VFGIGFDLLTQVLPYFSELVAVLGTLDVLSLLILLRAVHAAQHVVAQAAAVGVELAQIVGGVY